jgi:hypothetical protein
MVRDYYGRRWVRQVRSIGAADFRRFQDSDELLRSRATVDQQRRLATAGSRFSAHQPAGRASDALWA